MPIGANVGINKEGADPERDYPALVAAVSPYADYVVINVSSPNTPGPARAARGRAAARPSSRDRAGGRPRAAAAGQTRARSRRAGAGR